MNNNETPQTYAHTRTHTHAHTHTGTHTYTYIYCQGLARNACVFSDMHIYLFLSLFHSFCHFLLLLSLFLLLLSLSLSLSLSHTHTQPDTAVIRKPLVATCRHYTNTGSAEGACGSPSIFCRLKDKSEVNTPQGFGCGIKHLNSLTMQTE